ncbi:DUF5004 domain-containing protein [Tamlana agarivorans]|uniref:DUF5004 domain-containing protein n=1 Tax=Pseudotamlana agarivorans TaxID=481183 RepID=A0ACC5UCH1_9FLAO|nr:DUF5004 domain-containing protein [Tamlana agarivorans]MBU2952041.1 DUF5004 domain-containing protein [Tamlana agarivorans]
MNKSILVVKSILALTFLSALIVSCSDDTSESLCMDPLVGALTDHETEFSGTWILKSVVADEAIDLTDDDTDNPSTDIYAQYDACSQDASYTFSSDRGYTFEQGNQAGDCENQQEGDGTWKLEENNILTFVSNCFSANTALELNEDISEFSIEGPAVFQDVDGNNVKVIIITTYEKPAIN